MGSWRNAKTPSEHSNSFQKLPTRLRRRGKASVKQTFSNARTDSREAVRDFTSEQTNETHPQTMKPIRNTLALLAITFASLTATYAQDPLPSWNDGAAKQAIVDFVKTTTETGGANFVAPGGGSAPPERKLARFCA